MTDFQSDYDDRQREQAASSPIMIVADRASDLPFGHVEDYPFATCRSRVEGVLYERDVMAAILYERGSFAHIGARLGFPREKVRQFILSNHSCTMLHRQITDTVLDIAERNQMELAARGDSQAGRFLLQTIGRDRGYTASTPPPTVVNNHITNNLAVVLDGLSQRERDQLRAIAGAISQRSRDAA